MKSRCVVSGRPLSQTEATNLRKLNSYGVESAPLFITQTGFQKSICDATYSIRDFFLKNGVHDYSVQCQGPENKTIRDIIMVSSDGINKFRWASLRERAVVQKVRIVFGF